LSGLAAAPGPAPAEIGTLFRDLRRALKLSLPELASRLGTRIEVITALEKGDVSRLPPWPETARIVSAFTGMARIDARPVLGILRNQLVGRATTGVAAAPRAGTPWKAKMRAATALAAAAARATRRLASRRKEPREDEGSSFAESWRVHGATLARIGLVALVILALSGTAYYVRAGGLQASLAALPPPLSRLARSAQDYIVWYAAPTHDGLRWIDVEDPRARRGDRLDTRRR
jgi:transcriptional regulator with XRE-family HTH domain